LIITCPPNRTPKGADISKADIEGAHARRETRL